MNKIILLPLLLLSSFTIIQTAAPDDEVLELISEYADLKIPQSSDSQKVDLKIPQSSDSQKPEPSSTIEEGRGRSRRRKKKTTLSSESKEETDMIGCTALHYCAIRGNHLGAKELLDNNANVNATDFFNRTPLDRATTCNMLDILERYGGKSGFKINNHPYPARKQ